MVRWIIVVAAVLTVAVAGCRGTENVSQEPVARPTDVSAAEEALPVATQAAPPETSPEGMETVTVMVTFGGKGGGGSGESSEPGRNVGPSMGHGGGCPKTQIGTMLGVTIVRPHGCVIGDVNPDGRAAKAGIKPGDSIVECRGVAVSCPQELLPRLTSGREERDVELTIHRPKAGSGTPAAGKPAATKGESAPAPQGTEAPKSEQPKGE